MGLIEDLQKGISTVQKVTDALGFEPGNQLANQAADMVKDPSLKKAKDMAERVGPKGTEEVIEEAEQTVEQAQSKIPDGVKQMTSRFKLDKGGFPIDPEEAEQMASGTTAEEEVISQVQGISTGASNEGNIMIGDVFLQSVQVETLSERLTPHEHPDEQGDKFADDAMRENREIEVRGFFGNAYWPPRPQLRDRHDAMSRIVQMKEKAERVSIVTNFPPFTDEPFLVVDINSEHLGTSTKQVPSANGEFAPASGDAYEVSLTLRRKESSKVQNIGEGGGGSSNGGSSNGGSGPSSASPSTNASPPAPNDSPPAGGSTPPGGQRGLDNLTKGPTKAKPDNTTGQKMDKPTEDKGKDEPKQDDGGWLSNVVEGAKDAFNKVQNTYSNLKENPVTGPLVGAAESFVENNVPGAGVVMDAMSGDLGFNTLVDQAAAAVPGAGAVKTALDNPIVKSAASQVLPFGDEFTSAFGADNSTPASGQRPLNQPIPWEQRMASGLGVQGDRGQRPYGILAEMASESVGNDLTEEQQRAFRQMRSAATFEGVLAVYTGTFFHQLSDELVELQDIALVVGSWMGVPHDAMERGV